MTNVNWTTQYWTINYKQMTLGDKEQIGGADETKENQINLNDGLSKSELEKLDTNKDGMVTKEEFEAACNTYNATKDNWNSYLTAFNNKMNSNNQILNFSSADATSQIKLCDDKRGYYTSTARKNVETLMGSKNTMNLNEFKDLIQNKIGLTLNDGQISNAFNVIKGNRDDISSLELLSMFALADMGENASKMSIGTIQIDQTNGKFTKNDIKNAITQLANGNRSYTENYKKLHDSTIPIGYNNVSSYSSVKENEKITLAKENISILESNKSHDNQVLQDKINTWNKQMNCQISMYQKQIKQLQEVGDTTSVAGLRNLINQAKTTLKTNVDSIKKNQFNNQLTYSADIIDAKYKLEQTKKGLESKSIDFSNINSKLSNLYENNEHNSDFSLNSQSIYDIVGETQKLISNYPSMEKEIKSFVKEQLNSIKKRIEENIKYELEELKTTLSDSIEDSNLQQSNNIANAIKSVTSSTSSTDGTTQTYVAPTIATNVSPTIISNLTSFTALQKTYSDKIYLGQEMFKEIDKTINALVAE